MNIHIVEQPEVVAGSEGEFEAGSESVAECLKECVKKREKEYAAVFTLPSPALDHSGIGHLVEHLVFRTSAVFPERHNLFALTSMTRCKMNASTTGNKSYYFAQAETGEDLLLLIEYVYAGLMTRTYTKRDIEQEKSVIQHELAFYAKHPAYQKQSQIWRGDKHPDAYQHWGGFPDMLAQLTADDVYAYKSQYYQDSAISLLASGVTEEDINTVLCKVQASVDLAHEQALKHPKQPVIYQLNTLTDVKQDPNQPRIYSWWLPSQYQHSVLAQLPIWQTQWPELYVEEELNHRGQFAIRYLCPENDYPESVCREDECEAHAQKFAVWLANQLVTAEPQMPKMTQFPECIQALLASQYSSSELSVEHANSIGDKASNSVIATPISQLIGEPHISHFAQLPEHQMIKTTAIDSPKLSMTHHQDSPTIIQRFTDTVDCELGSYQPRTITRLVDDMGDELFYIKQDLWVIKVTDIPSQTMTRLCHLSAFWAPRVQGQLYTMGVFEQDGYYFVWGAGDKHPVDNMTYLQALIDGIKNSY